MKQTFVLTISILLLLFTGCKDESGMSFPDSFKSVIIIKRCNLYTAPIFKFVIKADMKDDINTLLISHMKPSRNSLKR